MALTATPTTPTTPAHALLAWAFRSLAACRCRALLGALLLSQLLSGCSLLDQWQREKLYRATLVASAEQWQQMRAERPELEAITVPLGSGAEQLQLLRWPAQPGRGNGERVLYLHGAFRHAFQNLAKAVPMQRAGLCVSCWTAVVGAPPRHRCRMRPASMKTPGLRGRLCRNKRQIRAGWSTATRWAQPWRCGWPSGWRGRALTARWCWRALPPASPMWRARRRVGWAAASQRWATSEWTRPVASPGSIHRCGFSMAAGTTRCRWR